MNLKDFLAARQNPPELFWSLLIEEGSVQGGIWNINGETSEVLGIGSNVPYESENELSEAVDTALSSTIQKLPEDYPEPTKTVFGVSSSWVTGGEIKDEHLAKIKAICTELTLTPVGFVVIPEAIAHLYKADEDAPLSGIVVGLGKDNLEISVFKMGNLIGSTQVSRSLSITDDVIEGLSRFEGASPLPSRFIVFDGRDGELEEAKEELIKHVWGEEEKMKFLHTPKAEVLGSERKVLAVSLAGASEIANVSKVEKKLGTEVVNIEPVTEEESASDLGFVIDKDVTEAPLPEPVKFQAPEPSTPKVDVIKKAKSLFHGISMPEVKAPKFSGKSPLMAIFVTLLIIVFGGGAVWYFLPKVSVTLFLAPKGFEESFELGFNKDNSRIEEIEVEGEKTKSTSGVKLIGDKAKGNVQIANGNASSIKLTAGTLLTSSSGLKFTTSKEASISGQLLPGSPGTAELEVNAADIGSQYNLAKGEVFTVGNFAKSLVAATSQSDFGGGSSREISAVSKEDQAGLEKELTDELMGKAKDELNERITADDIYLEEFSSVEVDSQEFDHKVGDEADTLKLSLVLKAQAVVPNKMKLFEYTKEKFEDTKPSGFVLRTDQVGYKFTFIEETDGTFNYKLNTTANYLPEVDVDKITKNVTGKTVGAAKKYFSTLPGLTRANLVFNNKIFGTIGFFPLNRKNIEVEITAEK